MNSNLSCFVKPYAVVAIIALVVGISIFYLLTTRSESREKFCAPQPPQHQPYPQKIQKPPPNPSNICTRPNGQKTLCGYASRNHKAISESNSSTHFTELKVCNKSPVTLDLYHRTNTNSFVYSGSIPTMKSLYIYSDSSNKPFSVGDEIFATKHGDSKILYQPAILQPKKNEIFFGTSSAETDESISIINLISEIGHIKFRNYSFASYILYYYGEYLGELKPYDKENNIYFELYVARSSQGFRLGSQVSAVMEGTDVVQNIALTHRTMTTLNIGLTTMQPLELTS